MVYGAMFASESEMRACDAHRIADHSCHPYARGAQQAALRVPHAERCAETFPAHNLWQFYRFLLSYLHLLYLYFYPVARVFAVSVAN